MGVQHVDISIRVVVETSETLKYHFDALLNIGLLFKRSIYLSALSAAW